MSLTTATKDWLAQNAGSGGCFAASGIAYNDPDGIARTGGTGDVLNAFVVANLVGSGASAVIIAATTYDWLKANKNGNADITINDVTWAYGNDGAPAGEIAYCTAVVTPTPTPVPGTPTPTPSPVGPAGTFVFVTAPTGIPTVTLSLTALVMRQALDYHFEMNDIVITNTSTNRVYLAMEVKLFTGALTTCPVTGHVFRGLDRTATRVARVKILEVGESAQYDADFYQPSAITGVHTVCLLIHGAWTRVDLDTEIAPITG